MLYGCEDSEEENKHFFILIYNINRIDSVQKNKTNMKRKHVQTDFIKFIVEKYSKEPEEGDDMENEDEIEMPDDEEGQSPHRKRKPKLVNEFDDEEETDDEKTVDDELIDELLNEYKRLKKKYESNRIHFRKKR